jgi:hypothetical protein
MRGPGSGARTAALLVLGALALHELRYLIAFGGEAPSILAQHGHGYLGFLAPLLVAGAAAAIVTSVVAPALLGRMAPARRPYTEERAAGYAAGLVAVFFAQELAESLLSGGHPDGVAAVLGAGGWVVLPLAIALGALAAFAARQLDRAALTVSRRFVPPRPRAPRQLGRLPAGPPPSLARFDLSFGFARRPPPAAPVV